MDARARRNNAGVAAPKYEPNEYGPPEKKLQRRSSGSKNGRIARRVRLTMYITFELHDDLDMLKFTQIIRAEVHYIMTMCSHWAVGTQQ